MIKLPSAKVYSESVSVSYPGQSPECVKVTTLGPRTLQRNTPSPQVLFLGFLVLNDSALVRLNTVIIYFKHHKETP